LTIDENEDRWHDLFLTSEEDNEIAVTTSIPTRSFQ
jgi:hypothetical protein